VLHSTSIFLSLKNEPRIFPFTETHEKGGPALKWSLLEQTTSAGNPIAVAILHLPALGAQWNSKHWSNPKAK